jgi:hypothetical protein
LNFENVRPKLPGYEQSFALRITGDAVQDGAFVETIDGAQKACEIDPA